MAKKKKSIEDLAFPVPCVQKLGNPPNLQESPEIIKTIILGAIKGAYQQKTPTEPNPYSSDYGKPQRPLVNEDQIQFIIHLIESLQLTNAIEAALASQFAITYVQGLKASIDHSKKMFEMFGFGHQVLETLQRYRTKGAQLISVNYNHNQGQINNIKVVESGNQQETLEVKNEL